jgi:hypothetical protein
MLCPAVFLGGAGEDKRGAEGCPEGLAQTGEGPRKRLLSRQIRPSPRFSSCSNFPIRARHSRFVRAVPSSCAAFPRDVVSWPLTGAIRSTPRGESLHPPGLNWSESLQRRGTPSRFVRAFPDSCAFRIWHATCMYFLT